MWLWMEGARGEDEKWRELPPPSLSLSGFLRGVCYGTKKVLFEKKVFRFRPLENRMINLAQGIILWMIKGIHLSFRFHPVVSDCVRESLGNLEVLRKSSRKLKNVCMSSRNLCLLPELLAKHSCWTLLSSFLILGKWDHTNVVWNSSKWIRHRENALEHLAVFWFSIYGVRGIQCSSIDVAHWAVISLVCYEADPAVLAMLTALWGRGEWATQPGITSIHLTHLELPHTVPSNILLLFPFISSP